MKEDRAGYRQLHNCATGYLHSREPAQPGKEKPPVEEAALISSIAIKPYPIKSKLRNPGHIASIVHE
jgi:hypothetical protein